MNTPPTEVPIEDVATLFKESNLPKVTPKYGEVDPTMAINNLSPLKRERLERATIKITKRSSPDISHKQAKKMVASSDNWDILKRDYAKQNAIVQDVLRSAHYFTSLPPDVLALTEITSSTLRTYLSDIQYFSNKLVNIKVINDHGRVTAESFLRYNAAMSDLDSLSDDTLKILAPMQAAMYIAQSIIERHYKELELKQNQPVENTDDRS
jgi:hypothetical protein